MKRLVIILMITWWISLCNCSDKSVVTLMQYYLRRRCILELAKKCCHSEIQSTKDECQKYFPDWCCHVYKYYGSTDAPMRFKRSEIEETETPTPVSSSLPAEIITETFFVASPCNKGFVLDANSYCVPEF